MPENPVVRLTEETVTTITLEMLGFSGVRSENLNQEDRLKIAIVGDFKTGKSWLASTAPSPIRFYDFDDRAESLAGKAGLLIARKPSMLDVETDLSIAKSRKLKGLPIPATWVFDTVTFMQKAMETEIFRQSPDLARKIRVGNATTMLIRNGWDAINGVQRYMEYIISEFSPLGNLIFVYHEKNEKDVVKSTKEETKYTGDITVDPQYLSKTLSLFNEVYRISVNFKGEYVVQCRPTNNFSASTTMLLAPEEKPDIMGMIEKHRAARAAAKEKK